MTFQFNTELLHFNLADYNELTTEDDKEVDEGEGDEEVGSEDGDMDIDEAENNGDLNYQLE